MTGVVTIESDVSTNVTESGIVWISIFVDLLFIIVAHDDSNVRIKMQSRDIFIKVLRDFLFIEIHMMNRSPLFYMQKHIIAKIPIGRC